MKSNRCAGALFVYFAIQPIVLAERYNPDQLINIALKNSALIESHKFEVKAGERFSEKVGLWDNPSLEVGIDKKSDADGKTRLTRYGLSQTFYLPGTLSTKKRVADGDTEISNQNLIFEEQRVVNSVLKLLYEFKAAKEKLSHAQERVERFKTAESYLKSRIFAAPQKKAEASIVAAKLLVLMKDQFQVQAHKENIWAELNSYLKMDSEPEIDLAWYKNGPQVGLDQLTEQTSEKNPDIKFQNAKLNQSISALDFAKIESWPSVALAASYSRGVGVSPERVYGLGLAVPLPFFNANSAGRAGSEFKVRSENARLTYVREKISKELRTAYLNLSLAKKTLIGLPVEKITELEKSVRETDEGFKRGQIDLLTYLEADNQHFESLSAILDAQLDVAKSISDLQSLTGNNRLYLEN